MQDIINSISKLGVAVLTAGASFIVYIILEKFKTRASIFTYVKSVNSVETTLAGNFVDNIEIKWGGRTIDHINFVSLTVKNESNIDFENVILKSWIDINSNFLNSSAHHDQLGTLIPLENEYYEKRLEKLSAIDEYNATEKEPNTPFPAEIKSAYDFVLKNLAYNVPVWNRGESVTFKFLIENTIGETSYFYHPIEKKSVKLIESETDQQKTKNRGLGMIIIGHILYVIAAILIASSKNVSDFAYYAFLIFGGFNIWIGLYIYQFYLYIKSFFK